MPWSPDMRQTQRSAKMLTPRGMQNESKKDRALTSQRKQMQVDMPGYTGYIAGYSSGPHYPHYSGRLGKDLRSNPHMEANRERKHPDLPFGTPNEMYSLEANPRKKTNVKNRSNLILGDDRDRHWKTTYEMDTEGVEDNKLPTAAAEEMITNWHYLDPAQRKVEYDRALHFVTEEGRKNAEMAVRDKITQRSTGGAFAIRKAFKLFDADGSGDIDPDEFKLAMLSFGLTFTDRQVLALFGSYDDDCSGALDYYEFLDKVLESDYKNEDGSKVASCRPRTPPRRHYCEELDLYRQMMRLKQMYNYCAAHETNRISVTEARHFLVECGHKEPDDDCILQIVQAVCPATNSGLVFTEVWDWFVGALDVECLDISPQMKVRSEREEHEEGHRDNQGMRHKTLMKHMKSGPVDIDGDGKVDHTEMQAWRQARAADVDKDGEATQEEIDAHRAKLHEDKLKTLEATSPGQGPIQGGGQHLDLDAEQENRPMMHGEHLRFGKDGKVHQGQSNIAFDLEKTNHHELTANDLTQGHRPPVPPLRVRPSTARPAVRPVPPLISRNSSRDGSDSNFRPFQQSGPKVPSRPSTARGPSKRPINIKVGVFTNTGEGNKPTSRPQTACPAGNTTYRCYQRLSSSSKMPARGIPDLLKRSWVSRPNTARAPSGYRV